MPFFAMNCGFGAEVRRRSTAAMAGTFALTAALAAWSTTGAAATAASSTFESGSEGWAIKDLAYPNPGSPPNVLETYTPKHTVTGGNPNGHLSRVDVSDKAWYWYAPDKFLGDKSSSYGAALSFDLAVTGNGGVTPGFKQQDVILFGAGKTLVFDTSPNFGVTQVVSWKSFNVGLTETGWKIGSLSGSAATAGDMQSVLGSLSAIYIRGEFLNGLDDIGRLDNVVLTAVPEPSSLAMFAVGMGYLGIRRKRLLARASQKT